MEMSQTVCKSFYSSKFYVHCGTIINTKQCAASINVHSSGTAEHQFQWLLRNVSDSADRALTALSDQS